MLICGGCVWGASEPGAFGFSNDRSLVYCASTLSWGGAPSGGLPLPLVMKCLLAQKSLVSGRVANMAPPCPTRRRPLAEASAGMRDEIGVIQPIHLRK